MAQATGVMVRLRSGGAWTFYPGSPEYAIRGLGPLNDLEIVTVTAPVDVTTSAPTVTGPIWTTAVRSGLRAPTSVEVPAGQNVAWIPVTADNTDTHSMYTTVSGVSNVSGGSINIGNATSQQAFLTNKTVYRWAIGDDRVHWIRVQLPSTSYANGNAINYILRHRGATNTSSTVTVRFVDGAVHPTRPAQYHRPIYRLGLTNATRNNTFNPSSFVATETGYVGNASSGTPCWRGRPAHGHTQDGNAETGIYLNNNMTGHLNPISYSSTEQAVRLHTEAFPDNAPYQYTNGRSYKQQAAMINGQRLNEVCGTAGVWRMVAKTCRRRFAWPAFWLIGRGGSTPANSYGVWPPEIDIMEQFNQVYGDDIPLTARWTSWAQHYGDAGVDRISSFGGEAYLDDVLGITEPLDQAYHSYSCAVIYDESNTRRSKVIFFFDDIEVGEALLYARHQNMTTRISFFPMANVAVKTSRIPSYTQAQYNTDDGRNNHGDMFIRDIGYYPSGFTLDPIPSGVIPNSY